MIFFVLLSLLLCLRLSLHHVSLILVFLKFILEYASLNVLKGFPSGLFMSNTIVADQINKHDTTVHELLLLVND